LAVRPALLELALMGQELCMKNTENAAKPKSAMA
jgi:hypothetical protein